MEKTSRNDPKQAYFRKSMHLKVLNMLITPSKPGFSLKIHSRLLVGSFWAIKHLPKLKIAKISFLLASCASRDNWSSGLVNLTLYVAGSINFGRIFIIYTPNESSWKSSITKYHSQSCVGTLNHANWPQIALLEHSFLMFTWLANGLSLKYWVLCSRVWAHLVQFTNFHNLQCYIQLRPQVRNGLSLKYRVLCSRVWPHLVQFTNLNNLQCHIQLRPQVRNGLTLKYRVLCSIVWPNHAQFTNYITLVMILLCHD